MTGDVSMPYVHIKITREGATAEQKAELIKGATKLLSDVLHKNPATTVVTIEEVDMDSWGIGGDPVVIARAKAKKKEQEIEKLKAKKAALERQLAALGKADPLLWKAPPEFAIDTKALKKEKKKKKHKK